MNRSSLYRSTQMVNHSGAPKGAFLRVSSTLYSCEAKGACCPACTMAWMVSSLGFSLVYLRTERCLSMVSMTGFCMVNSLKDLRI
jgi:predicted  nucleic acid-binding Zn ribbon protein